MSSLSASVPVIPDIQSLRGCVPSTAGAVPEIKYYNGSNVTVKTFVEDAVSGDDSTGCSGPEKLSCSWTAPATPTRTVQNELPISKTIAAVQPKETDSRLAQLGLVITLIGVISVVV